MLVQCPGCKVMVEMATFTAQDGRLSFSCSACRSTQTLKSAVAAAPSPPVSTEERTVAPTGSGEPALWAAWQKVQADWPTVRGHEQFVALCMSLDALPFAGTRYREHLDKHPQDPLALKGRDRVLAQAMAVANTRRSDAPATEKGTFPVKAAMVILLLAGCGAMVAYTFRTFATINKIDANGE
jgi:hypothetical protein